MGKHRSDALPIFPTLGIVGEEKIDTSPEIVVFDLKEKSGESYFFSSHFKLSDPVLELVLEAYHEKKKNVFEKIKKKKPKKVFFQKEILKEKELNQEVMKVLNGIFKNDGRKVISIMENIMMYYKDDESDVYETNFIVTKDKLFSDYMTENAPYLELEIKDIVFREDTIVDKNGEEISFDIIFPEIFLDFFSELKILGSEIKVPNTKHPLKNQSRDIRKKYMEILIAKCLEDGNFSSNEIVRLESIARQFNISSKETLEMIDKIWSWRKEYEDKEFIRKILENLKVIDDTLRCVLYHDIIIFDIMSNRQNIEQDNESEFTVNIVKKLKLQDEFAKEYKSVMKEFVKCSYELRDVLQSGNWLIRNNTIVDNIKNAIDYEYVIQNNSF